MSLEINTNIYDWLIQIRCLKEITSFRKLNSRKMQLDPRTTKKFALGSQFSKIIAHIVKNDDDMVLQFSANNLINIIRMMACVI